MSIDFIRFHAILNLVVCSTYILAGHQFRSGHGISDQASITVEKYIQCTGGLTIILSVIACILVKRKVTSLIHPILLTILMGFFIPGSALFGVYLQHKQAASDKLIKKVVKEEVVSYWKKHKAVWPLLDHLQNFRMCCGLNGPADYRAFIYSPCEKVESDVPYSCVFMEHLYEECRENGIKVFCNVHNFVHDIIKFDDPAMMNAMNALDGEAKLAYKCAHAKNSSAPKLCEARSFTIFHQGCLSSILENMYTLRQANYIVFGIIIVLSLWTLSTFLSCWFSHRKEKRLKLYYEKLHEKERETKLRKNKLKKRATQSSIDKKEGESKTESKIENEAGTPES